MVVRRGMPRGKPRKVKIYGIFKDDKCIFQGNRLEVAEHFGLKPCSIYDYVYPKKKKLFRRYVVRRMDIKVEEPPKPISENEQRLSFLENHLRIYGNCASVFDPVPFFPDLYDKGFDCKVREVADNENRVSGRRRKNVYYVTERV